MGKYFEILDDLDWPPGSRRRVVDSESGQVLELSAQWHLGFAYDADGVEYFGDEFILCKPIPVREPLLIERERAGIPMDFTLAGVDMPVVNDRVFQLLRDIPPTDVQWVPARIQDEPGEYKVLNVLRLINCLDYGRSEITGSWTEADGRPEKVGKPSGIWPTRFFIDAECVKGAEIFRVADWKVALIVSQRIKELFEGHSITGVKFNPVT